MKRIDDWKQNNSKNLIDLPVPFHGNHPQYNKYVQAQLEKIAENGGVTFEKLVELQNQMRQEIMNLDWGGTKNLNDLYRK